MHTHTYVISILALLFILFWVPLHKHPLRILLRLPLDNIIVLHSSTNSNHHHHFLCIFDENRPNKTHTYKHEVVVDMVSNQSTISLAHHILLPSFLITIFRFSCTYCCFSHIVVATYPSSTSFAKGDSPLWSPKGVVGFRVRVNDDDDDDE